MSEPINDGGPAFPVPMAIRKADGQPMTAAEFFEGGNGMTLRDYFAAKAIQGICANPAFDPTNQWHFENAAEDAFRMARAMIEERSK